MRKNNKMDKSNVHNFNKLPESEILNRSPQFTTVLMKKLNEMLEIDIILLTAFYPQINRQIERTNQKLEQYLRI